MADPPIGDGWRRNPGRRLNEEQQAMSGSIVLVNGLRYDGVRFGGWRWSRKDPRFVEEFDVDYYKKDRG